MGVVSTASRSGLQVHTRKKAIDAKNREVVRTVFRINPLLLTLTDSSFSVSQFIFLSCKVFLSLWGFFLGPSQYFLVLTREVRD